jgi:hypothetical protein
MKLRQAKKVFRSLNDYRYTTYRNARIRIRKLLPAARETEIRIKVMKLFKLFSCDEVYPNAKPFPAASWGDE